jgi:integrase
MSSIYRDDRSPFWTACFTAYVGQQAKQLKKTTATADKELAKLIAVKFEEAGRGVRAAEQIKSFLGEIPDLKARRAAHRAFDDVLRLITGTGLESRTTRSFVEGWKERTRGEVAPATWQRYDAVASSFLESLGGKAEQDIAQVRQEDIARFRDEEARRVSTSTVNLSLKILRVMFTAAESSRVVSRNEAKHVSLLKKRGKAAVRRAFTLKELKLILAACNDEWRSLVLFGFYSGGRLGDLATLTWENIDLERGELRYESAKTGRVVLVPLATPLREHIERLPAGDNPKQPLHPRAFEVVTQQGRVGSLSNEFYEVLVSAGLAKARSHKRDENVKSRRDGKRKPSEVSFHALRHSAVTMLKMAGVGEAVAMDLVGHDSAEISRHYTHVDHATKLDAVNRLPVLTAGAGRPAGKNKKAVKK